MFVDADLKSIEINLSGIKGKVWSTYVSSEGKGIYNQLSRTADSLDPTETGTLTVSNEIRV